MANEVPNKIEYGGRTLIDLTGDTATESDVAVGKTFHLASGMQSVGTRSGSYYITTESPNSVGTAVVGDAETGTPNYTPSGDVTVNSATLNWEYKNNRLWFYGTNPTTATFIGSGVNLLVKEETE